MQINKDLIIKNTSLDNLTCKLCEETNLDLNSFKSTGIYEFSTVSVPANIPPRASYRRGFLVVLGEDGPDSGAWVKQIWFTLDITEVYIRRCMGGTNWSDWNLAAWEMNWTSGDYFYVSEWYAGAFDVVSSTSGYRELFITIPTPRNFDGTNLIITSMSGSCRIYNADGTYSDIKFSSDTALLNGWLRGNNLTMRIRYSSSKTTTRQPVAVQIDGATFYFGTN